MTELLERIPDWLQYLVLVGAAITALGIVWAKIILPSFKGLRAAHLAITRLDESLPTIYGIAEEFRPNDGRSLRDVIDRIELRGEHATVQLREHLDTLACVAFLEIDTAGGVLWASRGWEKLTGIPASEARGGGWAQAIHPEDRGRVYAAWDDAVEHLRPFDMVFRYTSGKRVRGRAYPLRVDHKVVGWTSSVHLVGDGGKSACPLCTLVMEG